METYLTGGLLNVRALTVFIDDVGGREVNRSHCTFALLDTVLPVRGVLVVLLWSEVCSVSSFGTSKTFRGTRSSQDLESQDDINPRGHVDV